MMKRLWKRLLSSETGTAVAILALILSTVITIYFGLRQLPSRPSEIVFRTELDHRLFEEFDRFELPLKLKLLDETDHEVKWEKNQQDLRHVNINIENMGPGAIDWNEAFPDGVRFTLDDPTGQIIAVSSDPPPLKKRSDVPPVTHQISNDRKGFSLKTTFIKPNEGFRVSVIHTGHEGAIHLSARRKGGPNPILKTEDPPLMSSFLIGQFFVRQKLNDIVFGMMGVSTVFLLVTGRLAVKEPVKRLLLRAFLVGLSVPALIGITCTLFVDLLARQDVPINDGLILNCVWASIVLLGLMLLRIAYKAEWEQILSKLSKGCTALRSSRTAAKSQGGPERSPP